MITHSTRVSVRIRTSLVLAATVAFASTSTNLIAAPAQFAAASIRPNAKGKAGGEGSDQEKIVITPTGVTMTNVSLRSCFRWAYEVRDSQISGPSWLANERYDIVATTKSVVRSEEMRAMMQTLLTDRFRLQLRRETRQLPVYMMTVGKKTAKWKTAAGGPPSMMPAAGELVFRNFTMEALAERLAARPLSLDRPVIDDTGMQGMFDFSIRLADNDQDLKHTLEGMEQGSADQGPSMLTVLQEQLGLRFKSKRAGMASIVIQAAEKVPTAN